MINESIAIIGTGGMAKEIYGLCQDMGLMVLGFIAERADYLDTLMGLPIMTTDNEWLKARRTPCVIANGTPAIRRKIRDFYEFSVHTFPILISPRAIILDSLRECGRGTAIMPGGVIMPDVMIGSFVYINMGATIGHDCRIGDYSVINHNAGISGNVTIGEGVLIGAGATIIEGNTIGDGATVGAGAVVTKDIPPGETWVGVPARPMAVKNQKPPTYAELYGIN